MQERSREAIDAEALIAAEVERFHLRQRTVNVAPAIVALQKKAEEIRIAEIGRLHSRLGTLSAEQLAAVEALTRGLVNKFLHQPMQAFKQAARECDQAKLDTLCEEWSVSPAASGEILQSEAGQPATGAPVDSLRSSEKSVSGIESTEGTKLVDERIFEGKAEARR
jgi:glutamyl-tRNA reductase